MTFRPPRKSPQFADLKAILAQSKDTDNALYQTVEEIIDRLGHVQEKTIQDVADITTNIANAQTEITNIINNIVTTNTEATYHTKNDETGALPNSVQILAGPGIIFDDTVPNKRTIRSIGSMNLDYLGDYVPGTYNDGDIVIGADGVAYMCVVDGTTTPPEPWPMPTAGGGAGGSGGAPVNATYWVVSPHSELVNERALSTLANGYVKSTGGEPSTVAIIPISEGGTGASSAPSARTNLGLGTMSIQNHDNVNIVGGLISAFTAIDTNQRIVTVNVMQNSSMTVLGDNSALFLRDTSGAVDTRAWRLIGSGGLLLFQAINDANTVVQGAVFISRDGTFHGSGAGLTNLNASNLTTGLVATPRLGSGTANSGTFLRGDQVWAAPPTSEAFPSGLIVISIFPCPPGWTRIAWDGLFLRAGPTPGVTGGTPNHSHDTSGLVSQDHAHGAGSYVAANHDHGASVSVSVSISGNTGDAGQHSHPFSGSVSGTTLQDAANSMNVDAGGSGNMSRNTHQHAFSANFSGNTSDAGQHSHSFSGSGSGSGNIPANQPAVSGVSSNAGALPILGGLGVAAHLPPYVDVFFCQKN